MSWEGDAGFGGDVGLSDVSYYACGRSRALVVARVLREYDVDSGGPAAKLSVLDDDGRGASGSSTEEFDVESNGMWLVVCGERGGEVKLDSCQYIAGYDAAVRYTTDCPCVVEEDGVGSGVDSFHGGCFGEGSHCGETSRKWMG